MDDSPGTAAEDKENIVTNAQGVKAPHFAERPVANCLQPLGGDEVNISTSNEESECSVDLYAPPEDLAFALYG